MDPRIGHARTASALNRKSERLKREPGSPPKKALFAIERLLTGCVVLDVCCADQNQQVSFRRLRHLPLLAIGSRRTTSREWRYLNGQKKTFDATIHNACDFFDKRSRTVGDGPSRRFSNFCPVPRPRFECRYCLGAILSKLKERILPSLCRAGGSAPKRNGFRTSHGCRITCDMASIRTKAVSRTEFSCPVFVTPRGDQSSVEDQELRTSRLNHLRWS